MSVSKIERHSGVVRARDAALFLGIGESTFWRWVHKLAICRVGSNRRRFGRMAGGES